MGGYSYCGTVAYGYKVPFKLFKFDNGKNKSNDVIDNKVIECWDLFCKSLDKR